MRLETAERKEKMFTIQGMNCMVSQSFNGEPAVVFNDEKETVRFRVGSRKYDSRVEGNYRWININVIGYKGMKKRVESMKLEARSSVAISGELDMWEIVDDTTGEIKYVPVIVLSHIEYLVGKSRDKEAEKTQQQPASKTQKPAARGSGTPRRTYHQEDAAAPKNTASARRGTAPQASKVFGGYQPLDPDEFDDSFYPDDEEE